jgi:putative ABC transport system permease protein
MSPYALVYLYRNRLRVHAVQELLAGLGVAIAVALVFAALVANASLVGSTREVVHAVVGPASLQLRAHNNEGFDQSVLTSVQRIPGVTRAAPILEQTASLSGPRGRSVTIEVAGTDIGLAILDGLAQTLPVEALASGGIGLSKTTATELGIGAKTLMTQRPHVLLRLRGGAYSLDASAVLGPETIGALSQSLVAVMPLGRLQQMAGLQGRISRILVQTRSGHTHAVTAALRQLAAGRLTVAPATQDVSLLHQALGPSNQASDLFAAISALLGFLLAFNAILLTVPERRQAIADLRVDGTRRTAIAQMVLFQGLALGIAASVVGLLIGYALARTVFLQSPGYLAQAFPLGQNTVISLQPLLIALLGGMLATCLASATPLLDLRPRRALDAVYQEDGVPGNTFGEGIQLRLVLLAIGLLLLATLLYALAPTAAVADCVMLALAAMVAIPLMLVGTQRVAGLIALRYQRLTLLPVALSSLRATTIRSLALAATGAVALFGSIALGGAQSDLLGGLRAFADSYTTAGEIWVLNPGYTPETTSFSPARYASRIARVPGVTAVHTMQSEFLNAGNRRLVIIARPPGTDDELLRSQIVAGSFASASGHLREGGWIAVSRQIAAEQNVALGQTLSLPSTTGTARFRLAALTTNFGWPGGAVLMSTADYRRHWATDDPSALAVDLAPGLDVERERHAIFASLGPDTGLEAITAATWQDRFNTLASEGLSQLAEIAVLLVIAAILAMSAALGSNIWQRRLSLAGLRLEGTLPGRLRRLLFIEASLMLGAGCLAGALAGVYGQVVIDRYLKQVTGFPVASFATGQRPLEVIAMVVVTLLIVAVVGGWFAARVSPRAALDE